MAKAKTKAVVKGASIGKIVASSIESLMSVNDECVKALDSRSKEAKKNTAESKKLAKKRVTLVKRKKTAAAKLKNDPSAANKKAVKDVEKELAEVVKLSAKLKPAKQTNAEELAELKASAKALSAYVKAIAKVDKVLNKPKKKQKRKKRKAKVAA